MAKLLTVGEVSEFLGVSVKSVYQMIYMGKLSYVKMGPYRSSPVRFKQEEIMAFVEGCSIKAYRKLKTA